MSCLWRATTHNLALSFVQVFKFRILQNGISANLGGSQMTLLAKNLPMPRGLNVDVTNLGPMPSWKSCLSCLRLVVQHFHFHPLCSNVVQNVSGICIMQWLEVCYLSSKRWSTGKKRQEDFFLKNFEVGGISPGMGSLFPLFEYRGPRWIVVDLFQDILEKSTIIIFLHILNSYNNLIFLFRIISGCVQCRWKC